MGRAQTTIKRMGKSKSGRKSKTNKKLHEVKGKKQAFISKLEKSTQNSSRSPANKVNKDSPVSTTSGKHSKLSLLQQKFQKKLEGARFRTINERLYTCSGREAFNEFQSNTSLFDIYHEGFREQVKHWPLNPLDSIIGWIKSKHKGAVVADMGCGDARLAESIKNTTHSFDLVSTNSRVTACDISHVPLDDQSVDIVVFCLSLMGTNVGDFLREANRILRVGGRIKIAEVRSRFEGKETEGKGLQQFIKVLKKAGFDIVDRDSSNVMFFMLEGVKSNRILEIDESYSIQPCLYKKR